MLSLSAVPVTPVSGSGDSHADGHGRSSDSQSERERVRQNYAFQQYIIHYWNWHRISCLTELQVILIVTSTLNLPDKRHIQIKTSDLAANTNDNSATDRISKLNCACVLQRRCIRVWHNYVSHNIIILLTSSKIIIILKAVTRIIINYLDRTVSWWHRWTSVCMLCMKH